MRRCCAGPWLGHGRGRASTPSPTSGGGGDADAPHRADRHESGSFTPRQRHSVNVRAQQLDDYARKLQAALDEACLLPALPCPVASVLRDAALLRVPLAPHAQLCPSILTLVHAMLRDSAWLAHGSMLRDLLTACLGPLIERLADRWVDHLLSAPMLHRHAAACWCVRRRPASAADPARRLAAT